MNTNTTLEDTLGDVWDIRDLIELFEELETELIDVYNTQQDDNEDGEHASDDEDEDFLTWLEECVLDEVIEYRKIKDVLEELKDNGGDEGWRGDWYPGVMIAEDYFTEYAEKMVKDCEGLPREIPAYIEIDWERTARNILTDYSEIEINGTTYYYR
jgi:hypothetical protein